VALRAVSGNVFGDVQAHREMEFPVEVNWPRRSCALKRFDCDLKLSPVDVIAVHADDLADTQVLRFGE